MKFIKLKNSLQENSVSEKQLLDDLKIFQKHFQKIGKSHCFWQIS